MSPVKQKIHNIYKIQSIRSESFDSSCFSHNHFHQIELWTILKNLIQIILIFYVLLRSKDG